MGKKPLLLRKCSGVKWVRLYVLNIIALYWIKRITHIIVIYAICLTAIQKVTSGPLANK